MSVECFAQGAHQQISPLVSSGIWTSHLTGRMLLTARLPATFTLWWRGQFLNIRPHRGQAQIVCLILIGPIGCLGWVNDQSGQLWSPQPFYSLLESADTLSKSKPQKEEWGDERGEEKWENKKDSSNRPGGVLGDCESQRGCFELGFHHTQLANRNNSFFHGRKKHLFFKRGTITIFSKRHPKRFRI